MPSSSVRTYADPGEMETAHVAAKVELAPIGRESLSARAVRVELDHLWLTRTHESAARIKHVALSPARAFITFLTQPGPDVIIRGGIMPWTGVMRHSREHAYYERTSGPTHWGTMSMPVADMVAVGLATGGCDLEPPRDTSVVMPPQDAMSRLHRLHAMVEALARSTPSVIASQETARSLEQSLIEAMIGCLGSGETRAERWAQQCHTTIMRRFRRLLDDHPDRAIYVPEICAAIGVPERTLRHSCHEQLGMSPKQYLSLRRLHLVHRVLAAAAPSETTVSEVATRFGFWHFGRFGGSYKSIFGEPPSATLHKTHHG